jgi:hypothetical protein
MLAPTSESYWVEPGVLLAGKYPNLLPPRRDPGPLSKLLDCGVTLFLDLTEEHELEPYATLVAESARHVRMAIRDMDVTSREQVRRTLDLIDREHERDGVTYVHCWGGAGRTGTIVGCWLVRHGLDGAAALARIAALRAGNPELWRDSPETAAQRAMVSTWRPGA